MGDALCVMLYWIFSHYFLSSSFSLSLSLSLSFFLPYCVFMNILFLVNLWRKRVCQFNWSRGTSVKNELLDIDNILFSLRSAESNRQFLSSVYLIIWRHLAYNFLSIFNNLFDFVLFKFRDHQKYLRNPHILLIIISAFCISR